MEPETFHLAKLVKRYHPQWNKKSFKEIEDALLWYAIHGGVIHVTRPTGEALVLARRINDIGDRINGSACDPNGKILWIELFYKNDHAAAIGLVNLAIQKWNGQVDRIAFHQSRRDDFSCKIYGREFIFKYLKRLRRYI